MFMVYHHAFSDKGCSSENEIIHHLCAMYGIKQTTTTPYTSKQPQVHIILVEIHNVRDLIILWFAQVIIKG